MSLDQRGLFITLEGVEGVGKTTNMRFIEDWFEQRQIQYVATREPGGTPLAEELRELLLAKREETVDETAELLMVFAARAQHLNTHILPALHSGNAVLCDRFTDATFAYQGYGRGLSIDLIEQLEQQVQGELRPNLTIILDIDVEKGLERATQRAELDRFESEQVSFFERVRAGYKARALAFPSRYRVIDAGQSLSAVQSDISAVLESFVADQGL